MIFVTGMHRSGTSATSRVLSLLGASLGDEEELMPAQPDNPRGFWENRPISVLNEQILRNLGGSWDQPPDLPEGWTNLEALLPVRTLIVRQLETLKADGAAVHAVKDPRMSLTLPLWLEVVPQARVVLSLREPLAVCQSLKARNGLTFQQGASLWLEYVESLLGHWPDPVVVPYQDLLVRTDSVVDRLVAAFGLPSPTPDKRQQIHEFLTPELDHFAPSPGERLDPALQRATELFTTLATIRSCPPGLQHDGSRFERLPERGVPAAACSEVTMMFVMGREDVVAEQPISRAQQEQSARRVILHYHLFKNAGTSLDELFKDQFSQGWLTAEFPGNPGVNRQAVRDWIEEHPEAACFSSHTAMLPPPEIADVDVIPVIFVRHPLDRIASAYSFERKQGDPGFGSTLARNTSLAGYIETRLSIPSDRQCRNFHVDRFGRMSDGPPEGELDRAIRSLETLPFVGVVEDFENSLTRLQHLMESRGFTGLDLRPVRRNVSEGRSSSLADRLDRLAEELGPDCHQKLVEANQLDLAFYDEVLAAASR